MDNPKPDVYLNHAGWRRKTPTEARSRGSRFSLRNAMVFSIFGAGVGAAIAIFALVSLFIKDRDDWNPWVLAFIPGFAAFFAAASSIVAYLIQLLGLMEPPRPPRVGICNRCFKLTVKRLDLCECGGTFEDSDGWTLNRCPKCQYDLRGGPGRCPECGTELTLFPSDKESN